MWPPCSISLLACKLALFASFLNLKSKRIFNLEQATRAYFANKQENTKNGGHFEISCMTGIGNGTVMTFNQPRESWQEAFNNSSKGNIFKCDLMRLANGNLLLSRGLLVFFSPQQSIGSQHYCQSTGSMTIVS